jgi:segregation and condensation protein A
VSFAQTEESPIRVRLEVFEGPLDLLLHLIRENKLDIYDIPIASITEQYLEYLALMESMDLDIASEWMLMAATLLEIKSRMLLPRDPEPQSEEDAGDPREELVQRLLEYEKFKSAAGLFRQKESERSKVYVRAATGTDFEYRPQFDLSDITAHDLLVALQSVLADVGEEEITTIARRKISIRMRIRELHARIRESADGLLFTELFEDARDKVEVVLTFIALLELLKMLKVRAKQKGTFGPIRVVAVVGTDEPE